MSQHSKKPPEWANQVLAMTGKLQERIAEQLSDPAPTEPHHQTGVMVLAFWRPMSRQENIQRCGTALPYSDHTFSGVL